jgi:3-carboxy-cis,cis-muconate cycloisomerase
MSTTGTLMIDAITSSQLLTPPYASPAMRGIMSDTARLQRMLDFEAALARAGAAVGVITATSAVEIGDACKAEHFNIARLVEAAVPSGHLAIAVVDALRLEVARRDQAAARFVHWGATSQDVIDTALVLELRAAIDALLRDLEAAIKGFTALAGRHRRTLAVARTLLQQALPMPFGLKLAGYAAALARSRERLVRLRREALVLQFGGAAGTLAALGEHGFGVAERLAALLDLPLPDAPWHSHRDRLAEIAAAFAILAGTCGKIARDVALMMQTEVHEAFEPAAAGRGGSSTMPHKRNPVGAAAALSAATLAPNLAATLLAAQVQDHERGPGGWQTEWTTLPTLALATSGALSAIVEIAEGMEIDVNRLRANLEISGGQVMAEAVSFALAEKLGRAEAHRLIRELSQRAASEKRPLKELLLADPQVKGELSPVEIEKLFIPLTYQGSSQTFIDRLVVASQTRTARRTEIRQDTRQDVRQDTRQETRPEAQLDASHQTRHDLADEPRADSRHDVQRHEPPNPPREPRLLDTKLSEAKPSDGRLPSAPQLPLMADLEAPPAEPANEPPPENADRAGFDQANADIAETAAGSDAASSPAPFDTESAAAAALPPEPVPPPPVDEDAPGAFMDILSRAEAEAEASAPDSDKRKSS